MIIETYLALLAGGVIKSRKSLKKRPRLTEHQGKAVRTLSTEEIEAWRLPGYFISIAFAKHEEVMAWGCPACELVDKPVRMTTGGDGGAVPRYLVAALPNDEVLVAITGTDMTSPTSIACSIDLQLSAIDDLLLPGTAGKGIKIHRGFKHCFKRMRAELRRQVMDEVNRGSRTVILAGYSLGAALAYIVGVWLRLTLPKEIKIVVKGYGTPRIGNPAWADFVDQTLGENAARLVNYKDVVCRIPPRSLGYHHSGNEVFILKEAKTYQMCHEQECPECSGRFDTKKGWLKVTYRLRRYKELEHYGPYAGVMLHPTLLASNSSLQSGDSRRSEISETKLAMSIEYAALELRQASPVSGRTTGPLTEETTAALSTTPLSTDQA